MLFRGPLSLKLNWDLQQWIRLCLMIRMNLVCTAFFYNRQNTGTLKLRILQHFSFFWFLFSSSPLLDGFTCRSTQITIWTARFVFFLIVLAFFFFLHFSMTGQYRYDRKWVGERDGGWERERSTRWDSISGHPKCDCAICRRAAHKAIGADRFVFSASPAWASSPRHASQGTVPGSFCGVGDGE